MFHKFPDEFKVIKPFPYATHYVVWGKNALVSHAFFEPGMSHEGDKHPHEQITVVLNGEMTCTIGTETRILKPGDIGVILGDVTHGSKAGPDGCEALEIFSPPREEIINFPE